MFSSGMSVGIFDTSCVMPDLIVIALSIELKMSDSVPNPFVIALKVLSTVNVSEVRSQLVETTSHKQVKNI